MPTSRRNTSPPRPRTPARLFRTGLACAALWTSACATPEPPANTAPLRDIAVYHRAESARAERLALEVGRLRDDLRRAEEALVKVESGLRGNHTRANAVSEIAEVRIAIKKAAERAPWRAERIEEARGKLAEAERQVQQENAGAALFFVYRARRIAELALLEADAVAKHRDNWFVSGARVNLREGPTTNHRVVDVLTRETPVFLEREEDEWVLVRVISGPAGWVHRSLLRR